MPAEPSSSGYVAQQCRVAHLVGSARRDGGGALARGDVLSGIRWLTLPEDARLVVKHPRSGRELSFSGPARLLPCIEGQEEVLLARGSLRAIVGPGTRPGAEVVIGTPYGALRYASANATVSVSPAGLAVSVAAGEVHWLGRAPRAVLATSPLVVEAAGRVDFEASGAACRVSAGEAEALARALLTQGPKGLGERASRHLQARRRARTDCAVAAAVALDGEPEEARRARLLRLDGFRESYLRVPAAPR